MNIINDFISMYGTTILYSILTAVASFIGLKLKTIYEKYINDKTKRDVVESTVKYVEQIYKDLKGAKKLEKAKENIVALLNEKGISITELEMDVLIEAACNSFEKQITKKEEE
ncbi:MAG: hypothetical protein IJ272_00775 [Clostridia bacterium]|nr:hypothetical protein [Clostridia bacterium]